MSANITEDVDITDSLFKKASLLNVHLGAWSGQKSQSKNDEEAQGAKVVEKFYKKGQKILIDPALLKPFTAWRDRIRKHLERNASRFYLRGTWLVSHDIVPEMRTWLLDTRSKIMDDVEVFLAHYDTARTAQIEAFNAEYPEKAGTFDAEYPTVEKLAEKFRLNWTFGNWNAAKLDEVAAEEREAFRQQSRSYIEDLSKELRTSAAKCCAEFLKGLSTKSGEVNDKAIEKFKNFAARFKANNFLDDKELEAMMTNIETSALNITGWTSDEITQSEIKKHLQKIVELGADEGAAAGVASQYVRRVASATSPAELDQVEDQSAMQVHRRVSEVVSEDLAPEPEIEPAAPAAPTEEAVVA